MSSIPPATTDPTAPARAAAGPLNRPFEGPSDLMAEGPGFARLVGFIGLFLLVLGAVVVVATKATGTARIVPEGWGFLFAGLGIVMMLYHAITDGEEEVRRMYGLLAGAFLVLAVAAALLPGPFQGTADKVTGFYLLPWGIAGGFLALLFAVPFVRHETDELFRSVGVNGLLAVGAVLCVGVLVKGVWDPAWLAGTGLGLAVLGLSFLAAYLGQVNSDDGPGYTVAFTLGAVGAAAVLYAFGRTVFPTVLYDGPAVLRNAFQATDAWKATGRGLVVLAFLGLVALAALGRFPTWLRVSLAAVGLACACVFALASFRGVLTTPPQPFLVPGGLIIGGIGLAYLVVALGVCSDNQFVTLTRREFAWYFISPIGYLILGGMVAAHWLGYDDFIDFLEKVSAGGRGAFPEPIVRRYVIAIFPIFALTLMIPALTMRLFAEEKRTGTLEVMFTAPVSEWRVVLSKFLATWAFFMVCWVPPALYLIALRIEGGATFDYRPLLGFYLALGATGAAFVAMGIFFSSLAKDQVVAAVVTFVGMSGFLAAYWARERAVTYGKTAQLVLSKLSYIDIWFAAASGQLPVRDLLLWASLAVLFLILSIKVQEMRRWG